MHPSYSIFLAVLIIDGLNGTGSIKTGKNNGVELLGR